MRRMPRMPLYQLRHLQSLSEHACLRREWQVKAKLHPQALHAAYIAASATATASPTIPATSVLCVNATAAPIAAAATTTASSTTTGCNREHSQASDGSLLGSGVSLASNAGLLA